MAVLDGLAKQQLRTDPYASRSAEVGEAFTRYQLTEQAGLTRDYSPINPTYQAAKQLKEVDGGLTLVRLEYEPSNWRLDPGSTPVAIPKFLKSTSNLLHFKHKTISSEAPTARDERSGFRRGIVAPSDSGYASGKPATVSNRISHFDFSSLVKYRDEAKKAAAVAAPPAETASKNTRAENPPTPAPSDAATSWNNRIAGIWADAVLSHVPFSQEGAVVEVAPGDVPKIGLALKQRGFKGTLYVVEPERQALKKLIWLYKEMLPETTIVPVDKTLDQAVSSLPRSVNAVLSNHPLDDMIIGKALSEISFNDLFRDHYDKGPDDTRSLWQDLEAAPETLREIKRQVGAEWRALVEHTNPEVLAMSQYESYFFKTHNLPEPDANAFDVLQDLKGHLGETPDVISDQLERKGSDSSRWLVTLPRRRD